MEPDHRLTLRTNLTTSVKTWRLAARQSHHYVKCRLCARLLEKLAKEWPAL
jgi:hypothetical protein